MFVSCEQAGKHFVKVSSEKIDPSQIPRTLKYKGAIDTAVRFTDKDGQHLLLTSEDDQGDADNRLTGVLLYAYCYHLAGGKWTHSWQMQDFVTGCDFDVAGEFISGGFAVTDLNDDGRAEVWLLYRLACRSDVSPSDMKIIMHEGAAKYAMRGGTRVKVNGTDYSGGDYKFDAAFQHGPEAFRKHAQQLWARYRNENFDTAHPGGTVN